MGGCGGGGSGGGGTFMWSFKAGDCLIKLTVIRGLLAI